ncbi:nicotinate-nucleotide--dimethylbenzimidazole phosphoribosyltransferase [Anaerosacchariphilus polymeriproducens]|uniref:Nicotinate-nucleotide--dimethylbenzimidazole phosphoribosyltransferase n=1 Tax=Anaerosacchariphilus polymeriproducens TaxID=1812858 RepID=A0A371AYC8_9FIRM|nr:nicotinate-nucleotide--dimethylbenzimidazole phosphoribosyltransferase [Anaerosacchariphilus polymeriproducens]RDU24539.1 nicotinate-nucleotide--dimethylbenzimidazole phosphoribosyltransferase [Anaerosacchariphilus polymeriproducens]
MKLKQVIEMIQPADEKSMQLCRRRWDSIAKPLHSLGKMEDMLIKIAGMTKDTTMHLGKKALIVMCADNGVVEEGVTQSGQEVTAIVSENFWKTKATASIMCKTVGADIFPVDIGIAVDTNIINKKVAYGTKNMAKEPAMTKEEAIRAIEVGIDMVETLKEKGYGIIATGEMGIGNTTTSSAIAAILLDKKVEEVTGRGAGLSSEGLGRKITCIQKAIQLHAPDKEDAIDVIRKVGGLDIAGMTGVFLGGAALGTPIIIDGFISAVSALLAVKLCPHTKDYMLASHISNEPAAVMLLKELGLEASLVCDMCLGEGTGAISLYPILDIANAVYEGMATFDAVNIEKYQPLR